MRRLPPPTSVGPRTAWLAMFGAGRAAPPIGAVIPPTSGVDRVVAISKSLCRVALCGRSASVAGGPRRPRCSAPACARAAGPRQHAVWVPVQSGGGQCIRLIPTARVAAARRARVACGFPNAPRERAKGQACLAMCKHGQIL